jgi:hypothetical protein
MSNFVILNNLPIYDLYKEFNKLLEDKKLSWFIDKNGVEDKSQMCINTVKGKETDTNFGRGSLVYDWDKVYYDNNGNLAAPKRNITLNEEDFTVLCEQFKGSLFEEVYNELSKKYLIGRVRIMNTKPKTCLTWHVDDTTRIHYPMKTQDGCFMVIENEVKFLEQNVWYKTNTLVKHTAFNGSREARMHLVVNVLG